MQNYKKYDAHYDTILTNIWCFFAEKEKMVILWAEYVTIRNSFFYTFATRYVVKMQLFVLISRF